MGETADALRLAILSTDRELSKFRPLPTILAYDDFDDGVNGWAELCGNHNGDLNEIRSLYRDLRPPQLSNCGFFDIGTHGSMSGTYALKIATRSKANHIACCVKRLTARGVGLVQFEMYFTFKAEARIRDGSQSHDQWDGNRDPSELEFGSFTIGNDICEAGTGARYHQTVRYVNAEADRRLVQKWTVPTSVQATTKMQLADPTIVPSDLYALRAEDWADVPDGHQPLCYNEVPTKINWHYLRWLVDTKSRTMVELQVNEAIHPLDSVHVPLYEHAYVGLPQLLNFSLDVQTAADRRNFLFVDSVLISAEA